MKRKLIKNIVLFFSISFLAFKNYSIASSAKDSYLTEPSKKLLILYIAISTFICLFILGYFIIKIKKVEYYIKKFYGFNRSKIITKNLKKDIDPKEMLHGDIFEINYIAYMYGIIDKKENIIFAIILKWLNSGIIKIRYSEEKNKRDKLQIELIKGYDIDLDNSKEKELYELLYIASNNEVVDYKKLRNWCKSNFNKYFNWIKDLMKEQRIKLKAQGLIKRKRKILSIQYIETELLKKKAIEIAKFKNLLSNFDIYQNKILNESTNFEDLMIFIHLFGISKTFNKKNQEIYCEMVNKTQGYTYENLIEFEKWVIKAFSTTMVYSRYTHFKYF